MSDSIRHRMPRMIHAGILPFFLLFVMAGMTSAQSQASGVKALQAIKDGYLIVRLPTYEKKLSLLDSLMHRPGISEKALASLQEEYAETQEDSSLIWKWYPLIFERIYTFSKVAFLPSSKTSDFEKGLFHAVSVTGEPLPGIADRPYVFASLQGTYGDAFSFTTAEHQRPGHPMPGDILVSAFQGFFYLKADLGEKKRGFESSVMYAHVHRLNRKLHKAYQKVAGSG